MNVPVELVVWAVGGVFGVLTLNAHLLFSLYTRIGTLDTRTQVRLGNLETRVFGMHRSNNNAGESGN